MCNRLQKVGGHMATMREVAKLANVSVATVSRYINKSGYVSKAAKENIQKIIDEVNYTPNEVARSLYQKKSKFIGVLLPDITNPFVTMLSKGIEQRLNESEYGLILANVDNSKVKEEQYLTNFKSNNIAGVISAIEHQCKIDQGLLHVSIDRYSKIGDYSVASDDFSGGQLAASEISKRTTKEIFIINSNEHTEKSKLRIDGMLSILEETKHRYHIHNVATFKPDEAAGVIELIIRDYPEVDSIIAANDVQAMVLLKEAHEHGLKVPDDIQIIGYDDITFARLTTPGLSTIAQPIYEMGTLGAELMLKMINGEKITDENIVLPVKFINRGTLRKL